jgi:hypothetical protein
VTGVWPLIGQVLVLCLLAFVIDVLARLLVELVVDWRFARRWARLTTSEREGLLLDQLRAVYEGRPVPAAPPPDGTPRPAKPVGKPLRDSAGEGR